MNPSSAETRRLVVRAIDGNRSAIEQLLTAYRPQLRRMVAVRMDSRLKARLDPSDVVQSVLAEASQKMVTFRSDPEQFFLWLRQLAWDELARLRRDHIQTQKRSVNREEYDWQGQAADESMLELADRLAAQQLGPGSRLVHKETRDRVRTALAELPSQDREILVLRFLEQLDIDSAAAALGISIAAVKLRQFRAVDRLGKLLSDLRRGGPLMNAIEVDRPSAENEQLAEIVEQIAAKLQAGEACNIDDYVSRFPEYAGRLRDWMNVMTAMADLGHSLAGATVGMPTPVGEFLRNSQSDSGRSALPVAGLLGDFRILRELGRGGMGVVYEAEQISLGRHVALKVLPFAAMLDKQQLARFKNEARAAATLDHPNIVAIHSVGAERGVHYYAMQLIEGQSLAQIIAELKTGCSPSAGNTDPPAVHRHDTAAGDTVRAALSTLRSNSGAALFQAIARIGIQAAEALDHAHQSGILHRDIKPANLLLDVAGKLWITDFGLARIEADAGMTMTGDLLGTLRYMSPEQALAKRVVVDHRSDIYSLGVTLYELVTLRPAYGADDRHELLRQIAFEEPRKPRQLNASIPLDLETILLKSIEKNSGDRYATAKDFAEDLRRFLEHQPIKAKPTNFVRQFTKWSQRNVAAVRAASVLLVISTVILAVTTVLVTQAYRREARSARLAAEETDRARHAAELETRQRERVEELMKLLVDVFRSPDPRRDGRKITVAEILDRSVNDIRSKFVGDSRIKAELLGTLGVSYRTLGLYREAIQLCEQSHQIHVRQHGENDSGTIVAAIDLGVAYGNAGRVDQAVKLLEDTLSRSRTEFGEHDGRTRRAMSELAEYYTFQGKMSEAIQLDEELVRWAKITLGPRDTATIRYSQKLGVAFLQIGRFDEGLPILEDAYQFFTDFYRTENVPVRNARFDVAWAYYLVGRRDQAQRMIERLLETDRTSFGLADRKTGDTIGLHVWSLIEGNKFSEARQFCERTLEEHRRVLGPEHPATLSVMRHLTRVFTLTTDELDEADTRIAASLGKEVVEVGCRVAGPLHAATLQSKFEVGLLLAKIGRTNDAYELFCKTLEESQNELGADDLLTQTLRTHAAKNVQKGEPADKPSVEDIRFLKHCQFKLHFQQVTETSDVSLAPEK